MDPVRRSSGASMSINLQDRSAGPVTAIQTASGADSGNSRRERLARACHGLGLLGTLERLRSMLRRDVRILAYHRVLDVDPTGPGFDFDAELVSASVEQFREQMRWLRAKFRPIGFAGLLRHVREGRDPPPRTALVTFDDGYDDNRALASPVPAELGVPATDFVSAGPIESGLPDACGWLGRMLLRAADPRRELPQVRIQCHLPRGRQGRRALAARVLAGLKRLDDAAQGELISGLERAWGMPRRPHPQCRPMTWDQLRVMQAGGMEVGSHGVGHRMLAKLPPARMAAEIHGSMAALRRELGDAERVISYPVGGWDAFDDAVIGQARGAGFVMGCSYLSGTSPLSHDTLYALRRLHVERQTGRAEFRAMLAAPEVFGHPSRMPPTAGVQVAR